MDGKLIIGTRGSKLALWQAHYTQAQLREAGIESELRIIKTQGDRIQHLTFDKLEGKGFFTKEIEDALLAGEIDLAVHSMKDLPTTAPAGLVITAVSYRANPADWLLVRPESYTPGARFGLADNSTVGTSSARRKAQIKDLHPTLTTQDVRGNVPTRIEKLRRGDFDGLLLAAAGLERLELDLSDLHIVKFHPREFVPAPAQGVLAFQTRQEDVATRRQLQHLHHTQVSAVTNVERKVLNLLDGGCQLPLGVYCELDTQGGYHVWAAYAESAEGPLQRCQLSSSTHDGLAERVIAAFRD